MTSTADLGVHMARVARALLGDPNPDCRARNGCATAIAAPSRSTWQRARFTITKLAKVVAYLP